SVPSSVPGARPMFLDSQFQRNGAEADAVQVVEAPLHKLVNVVNLANAIREYGHLAAQLDPLGSEPPGDPALDLDAYDLSEADLRALPPDPVCGPLMEACDSAWDAIVELRRVYQGSTGFDFDHLRNPDEREWLREMVETEAFRPPHDPINAVGLLQRLTQVEGFELFLQRTFPGKTRFSIEGLDMMVPMLDEIIGEAAEVDTRAVIMGMAHRGRLNVLAHVLNKPYDLMLAEFKDPVNIRNVAAANDVGWTGDVKYHAGARWSIETDDMLDVVVNIAPNPSHLEHVNPVVEGMARAAGTTDDAPGPPQFDENRSLPIIIHGDAAFSGQGIVAETLNFSRIPGYTTGGSIHIIANNQLGFTTGPQEGRSTLYASDLAKGFKIPIVHVNADDPVACIEAARLAVAYRNQFQRDFLIDLVGYRRYGHNEGDEPRFTQPRLYARIEEHPSVRVQWGQLLESEGAIEDGEMETQLQTQLQHLQKTLDELDVDAVEIAPQLEKPPAGAASQAKTGVALEKLTELLDSLLTLPEDFTFNSKLERMMRRRREAGNAPDEALIDWATAETLAFGAILAEGTPIRLTGQDSIRGTFSQRHSVLYDVETGAPWVPLHHSADVRAAFEVRNSPLSENAAIGFEYGYNIQSPTTFVLWEAQYGDFINSGQSVIDEFVVSGRAKWGQTPSLALLLPHGYEGQGPDHSTGRLERFLQLAAETNLRIANCTSAAQYFHLLRRQAAVLTTDPLPLVVMTPKSLLRQPLAFSRLRDLAEGRWEPVLDDPGDAAAEQPETITRVVLCSGKIFVDLVSDDLRGEHPETAIVRVEQLYPFPGEGVKTILARYGKAKQIVWAQEEPMNAGAWSFVAPLLREQLRRGQKLTYVGRPRWASPAEGFSAWHQAKQAALVQAAYGKTPE
ncbi:MAG: 2-oxoglutarate dehydrogenase E1 component, partial [Litorilinea sp.]